MFPAIQSASWQNNWITWKIEKMQITMYNVYLFPFVFFFNDLSNRCCLAHTPLFSFRENVISMWSVFCGCIQSKCIVYCLRYPHYVLWKQDKHFQNNIGQMESTTLHDWYMRFKNVILEFSFLGLYNLDWTIYIFFFVTENGKTLRKWNKMSLELEWTKV